MWQFFGAGLSASCHSVAASSQRMRLYAVRLIRKLETCTRFPISSSRDPVRPILDDIVVELSLKLHSSWRTYRPGQVFDQVRFREHGMAVIPSAIGADQEGPHNSISPLSRNAVIQTTHADTTDEYSRTWESGRIETRLKLQKWEHIVVL